jgi:hypothetical protein
MKLQRRSPWTGIVNQLDLPITQNEYDRWYHNGEVAQNVWPHLTDEQREFIISGTYPGEWGKYMSEDGSDA